MNTEPTVAVVAGVGRGLGASLCRKLAMAGYTVAGLARSAGINVELSVEIARAGGRMSFYACDLTDPDAVATTFTRIGNEMGPPRVLVYNAGSYIVRPTAETSHQEFHDLWSLNCFGAFLCAQQALPAMLAAGGGSILFVGATASVKAGGQFAAFGSSKFALRGLAQSLARELGPQGIHVAHLVIDGLIWTPRTRDMPGVEEHKCLRPEAIADTSLHLIQQERSAWTHELDLRPDLESF